MLIFGDHLCAVNRSLYRKKKYSGLYYILPSARLDPRTALSCSCDPTVIMFLSVIIKNQQPNRLINQPRMLLTDYYISWIGNDP